MTLNKAAEIILKDCMNVKEGEKVLIIIDKNKLNIGEAILKKSKEITESLLLEIPMLDFNGQEPDKETADMMKDYDVIIIATTKSLSHTEARKQACNAGARIASMPNITEEMMERALTVNHKNMTETTEKINNVLMGKKKVRVTTEKGTDITMVMDERFKFTDQGMYHKKGDWGNLPAGEAGGAPVEGTTNGILIIDGSFPNLGKLEEPITFIIEKGKVIEIKGGKDADKVRVLLESFKDPAVYNIAELGIGTNEKAIITGNVLEDEKVLGTAHIAVGNNTAYGGTVDAPCHLDGVFLKPTIYIEENKIMEHGKILL